MAVKFIGGGNRNTRRKPWTRRKSLTNLSHNITWEGFELTTLVVIGKINCFHVCMFLSQTDLVYRHFCIWQWRLWCKISPSFFSSLYFVWNVWTQIAKYTIVEDKQNSWTATVLTHAFLEREKESYIKFWGCTEKGVGLVFECQCPESVTQVKMMGILFYLQASNNIFGQKKTWIAVII